ncbi:MAG: NTE family protein [Lentisphaeria bacterium]
MATIKNSNQIEATSIGLALGGGGVKGLAHIALLKHLDYLGVKPNVIAGTSMGAIVGALYARGLSGIEIEERVHAHIVSRKETVKEVFKRRKHLLKWAKVFSYEKARGGLFNADGLFEHLFSEIVDVSFEELTTPFTAVATDYHLGTEVALTEGPLLPAVRASMAVPGVFAPVTLNKRLLVDGGLTNNVPCEYAAFHHLETNRRGSDIDVSEKNSDKKNAKGLISHLLIASDVICLPAHPNPKSIQVMSGSVSIMLKAATRQKLALHPPQFLFSPLTEDIDAFDFHKIRQVLERGEQAVNASREALDKLLQASS